MLKTSEETSGQYLLGLLEVSPGGGNPMHTHSLFEETFTAVEGRLGVRYGDKKIYLKPGGGYWKSIIASDQRCAAGRHFDPGSKYAHKRPETFRASCQASFSGTQR